MPNTSDDDQAATCNLLEHVAVIVGLDGRAIRRWENEGGQCEHAHSDVVQSSVVRKVHAITSGGRSMSGTTETEARRPAEVDEALDTEAQGEAPTSDDAEVLEDEDLQETDAIGKAAGIRVPRNTPLGGRDEIAHRDEHRWELDPASAEDAARRGT